MTANALQVTPTDDRPPYRLAALAFLVVLAGYVVSLAPTVTFWDAGEFIATRHILGIPHPPGTPFFVLLGHVWDMMLPGLPTAYRMNLMSATFSAGAAALFFLFVHESLRLVSAGMDAGTARLFRVGGAFAATLCSSFAFTVWQISNDSGKVYQVAMFLIALNVWLVWMWRRDRGGVNGAHLLLLVVYLFGLSLANHLITLLGGPALFAFIFHTLRTQPARDEAERRVQWAQFAVAVAIWVTLVGLSMGSNGQPVLLLGLVLYVLAAAFAFRAGTGLFGVVALVVAALGVSTYAFLYIRAGQQPFINEADGSTLRNLWAIIGRDQYPPRSPFDNPIYPSGPDNPGRTLQLVGLQFLNWFQYFDWQWAGSLMRRVSLLAPARLPFTALFIVLGVLGALEQRRGDRAGFWLIAMLFLTTSVGLVIYLNFKPGYSIAPDLFPDRNAHEVRERDYFYSISYLAWGLWSGIGIAALFRRARERLAGGPAIAAAPVLLLALLPLTLSFKAADRRFTPAATLPRDFAYDMLIGVEPYGLLFTNGDNDTFPLWYLQEVEGVRQDVMVVNLSLVNTDWYIRQLRDNPARPYRPDSNALRLFGPGPAGPPPSCTGRQLDSLNAWAARAHRHLPDPAFGRPMCLHTLNDDQVEAIQPQLLQQDVDFRAGNVVHRYPAGTPLYIKDIMILRLIQENLGKRPIYFALTAGTGNRMGLDRYMLQQGLAFKLFPDTVAMGGDHADMRPLWGVPVAMDVERTRELTWDIYRYARLFDVDTLSLEPTDANIADNLSISFLALGLVYQQRGDLAQAAANYERSNHLSSNPQVAAIIASIRAAASLPLTGAGDTSASAGARDTSKH